MFNDKQLFLNVQDSLSPLQIGYDFEFGVNGGWLPLFLPQSKTSKSNKDEEQQDPFDSTSARGAVSGGGSF